MERHRVPSKENVFCERIVSNTDTGEGSRQVSTTVNDSEASSTTDLTKTKIHLDWI